MTTIISDEQIQYWKLIHSIFEKNKDGQKLLDMWTKIYLYSPCIDGKNDWFPFVREGENRLVRGIVTDLKQYEHYIRSKNGESTKHTN